MIENSFWGTKCLKYSGKNSCWLHSGIWMSYIPIILWGKCPPLPFVLGGFCPFMPIFTGWGRKYPGKLITKQQFVRYEQHVDLPSFYYHWKTWLMWINVSSRKELPSWFSVCAVLSLVFCFLSRLVSWAGCGIEPRHEKTCLRGLRPVTVTVMPAQLMRLARILKFRL